MKKEKEWCEMSARERDCLVAEKIFGNTVAVDVWDTRSCDELTPKYDFGVFEDGRIEASVPHYTSSAYAAMGVLDTIPGPVVALRNDNGKWQVRTAAHRVDITASDWCDTLPEAICLYALGLKS